MNFMSRFSSVQLFIRRRWKMLLILAIILGLVIFFFLNKTRPKEEKLTFIKPTRGTLAKTLSVSGVVDAKEKASLRFIAGGKLTYLGATEGATVKKGQLLAKIDARELQKNLEKDLNNYSVQRLTFDQNQETRKDQAPTNTLNRSNQTDQKTLENEILDVQIRDIAIQNTNLTSPLAGVLVTSPAVVPGVTLLATDIFEVINPQSLVFRAAVDEVDIASVKAGQAAKIQLDAFADQSIDSSVSFIAYKSSQSATGTVFVVELPISASNSELSKYRIGLNGDADIILEEKEDVLSIPLSSTKEHDGKTFVQLKTGEKTTEEREITKGMETDERVEVLSGLSQQDEIVEP